MRTLHIGVVVLTVAAALTLSWTPVVEASSSHGAKSIVPPIAMGSCVDQIGRTYRSNDWIVGYGSLSNCGAGAGTATLAIQRSRWFGWESMASAIVSGPGYDQYVSYNCAGTGTHDFRTLITNDQDGSWKLSNTITAIC